VVALLHAPSLPETSNESITLVPTQARISHVLLGYAIIRAIDVEAREFHVVAPGVDLENVNLIARGAVEIPAVMMSNGGGLYSTFMFSEGIGAAKGRNRHIQRRGN
jgi:hypothetical protein